MICLSLSCRRGHPFEGWFAGDEDYEKQKSAGLIACPVCGTAQIGKMPMTSDKAEKAASVSKGSGEPEAERTEGSALGEGSGAVVAEAGNNAEKGAAEAEAGAEEAAETLSPINRMQVSETLLQTLLRLRQMQKRKLEALHKLQDLARKLRESSKDTGE